MGFDFIQKKFVKYVDETANRVVRCKMKKLLLLVSTIAMLTSLSACRLDPAKTPKCTGKERWPDPCAR